MNCSGLILDIMLIYFQASQAKILQKSLPPDLVCVCLVLRGVLLVPQVFFPNKNKINWGFGRAPNSAGGHLLFTCL